MAMQSSEGLEAAHNESEAEAVEHKTRTLV